MNENSSLQHVNKRVINPLVIIATLFFIFGFVTWLNGILIPFLKIACGLTLYVEAIMVTFAFYMSYVVMAAPSSWVLHKVGFKQGISLGLVIMAVGSLVFIPAALSRSFIIFLSGLFIQGAGLTLLQTAVNPYVTLLGPTESAARRISIMGICNKTAGVISPLVMGAIVLKGSDQLIGQLNIVSGSNKIIILNHLAQRIILPYVIMTLVLVLLAIMVWFTHLPEIETDTKDDFITADGTRKTNIFQFPNLIIGFISLFLYVGVEVMAGDTIVPYCQSQGIALDIARKFTTLTLASMVIGYIIGIFTIPRYIKQHNALAISAILGIVLSMAAIFTSGYTSVCCIGLLGLANAIMWPAIWPLAISNLGKFTKNGSALLIMGIAGGATIPLLYAYFTDIFHNLQEPYWIMVPIYTFILYFATLGYKLK
jgi:glucose/galactose transporter